MEKEKEPIVLTENAPLSEWLGRLLEVRWFERGMEIAYQRAAYPEPGQCVTVDYDAYADRLREVLEERIQALLDACPVRLDQPIRQTVIGKSEIQDDDETTVANSSDVSAADAAEDALDAARKALRPGDFVDVNLGDTHFPAKVTTIPHRHYGNVVVGVQFQPGMAGSTFALENVIPLRKVVEDA